MIRAALSLLLLLSLAATRGWAQEDPLPARYPSARLDSIQIQYADGRGRERALIHRQDGVPYLGLGDVGRLAGGGYTWDPETYRGSFRVDSLTVSFCLDTPVFWSGARPIQLEAPVRYADDGVELPFGVLGALVLPRLGERARWDPDLGRLEIGEGRPWLDAIDVKSSGNRLVLTVSPVADGTPHRILWDSMGLLSIEVSGLHLPPGYRPPATRGAGVNDIDVSSTTAGVALQLHLEASWVGVRSRRNGSEHALVVELTRNRKDLSSLGFSALDLYPPAAGRQRLGQPRRVLLEVATTGGASAAGDAYVEALAQEFATALTVDFGHEVLRLPDREHEVDPADTRGRREVPGVPEADCWIGLRLERYPETEQPRFLIVTAGAPSRWEVVAAEGISNAPDEDVRSPEASRAEVRADYRRSGASALDGFQPAPWGQAARLHRSGAETLARNLADHLAVEMTDRPISIQARPARIFRGLSMPALLVYPASLHDEVGIAQLSVPELLVRTARSLAFGVDEYLLTHPDEP